MEKVQLNFTEAAEIVLRRTTTELYKQYTHPEDMQLFVQIVGDDRSNTPDIYIDNVTLKTLYYTLSQLNNAALNNCLIWLRAYDGAPLQEFATVCETRFADFAVNGCAFNLCNFTACSSDKTASWSDILILHVDEIEEIYSRIIDIINNNNN